MLMPLKPAVYRIEVEEHINKTMWEIKASKSETETY